MRMRFSVCSTRCSPRLRDLSQSPRVDRGLDGPATRSAIVRRWSVAFSEWSTLPWPRPRTGIQVCFFSMPVWPSPLLASSSASNRIPGVALLARFSWIEIIFGAFLIITAWRIAFHDESQVDPEHNPLFRLARRILPVTAGYRGHHMFVRESDKRYATPLFLVLVFVE